MRVTDLIPWRSDDRRLSPRNNDVDPVGALQLDINRAFDDFWRMFEFPMAKSMSDD